MCVYHRYMGREGGAYATCCDGHRLHLVADVPIAIWRVIDVLCLGTDTGEGIAVRPLGGQA